jgi:hypothetical protein
VKAQELHSYLYHLGSHRTRPSDRRLEVVVLVVAHIPFVLDPLSALYQRDSAGYSCRSFRKYI